MAKLADIIQMSCSRFIFTLCSNENVCFLLLVLFIVYVRVPVCVCLHHIQFGVCICSIHCFYDGKHINDAAIHRQNQIKQYYSVFTTSTQTTVAMVE